MQADGFVLRLGPEEFVVVSYFAPAAALRVHLERFIIADDVLIADETDRWTGAGVWGDDAAAQLRAAGVEVPQPGLFARTGDALCFAGRRSAGPNFELLFPAGAAPVGWRGEADAGAMERERIRSGIPAVPTDLGPGDLPNEGGLEEVAISFTKGCFTGQEVMARLKNLGQVRRRLMVLRGPGAAPPSHSPLYQGAKKVGEMRSAVDAGNGFVGLGMMSLLALNPAAELALAPDGPAGIIVNGHG